MLEAELGLGRFSSWNPAQAVLEGLNPLLETIIRSYQLLKVGRSLAYQLFHVVRSIDRSFLLQSLDEAPINDAGIWATCTFQLLLAVRAELQDLLVLLLAQEAGSWFISLGCLESLL